MATNFPASLDTLTNPSATDTLDSPPHDEQHADANDAIEALQAKVGVDSSAVTSSLDYKVSDHGSRLSSLEAVSHGKILQVVSTTKTDTFSASVAVGAVTDVTGLSATITPSAASSKILVVASVHGGNTATNVYAGLTVVLKRDSTQISIGDAASNRLRTTASSLPLSSSSTSSMSNVTFNYLDSPSTTSATTYQIEIANSVISGTTNTLYVNRSSSDPDFNYVPRPTSTITVMEVSA